MAFLEARFIGAPFTIFAGLSLKRLIFVRTEAASDG
jgi:hypothetical protein